LTENLIRLNETTHVDQLILVDLVDEDDEDSGPQTSDLQRLTMRDLNKRKIITHPIDRSSLSYFTFALAIELIYSNIFNVITD
jgi:hypothetical protein